jgi:sec-independent protein translocase protein TatC
MTEPARQLSAGDENAPLPEDDDPMTVFEHVGELRLRIMRCLGASIPGMAVAWSIKEWLLDFLVDPLTHAWASRPEWGEPSIHFANPIDPFVAYLKIAIIVGVIFASPVIFHQVWGFVSPGLYSREKKYAIPFMLASTTFFIGGAFFGYALVFPLAFDALLGIGEMQPGMVDVVPTIMINEYLTFATRMLVAFGLVFEIPVVVTFLALAHIVNWKQLYSFGRWWILIAAVLSAFLTPPDVGSQLMMIVPLVVLYFMSVGLAYLFGPKVEEEEEEEGA